MLLRLIQIDQETVDQEERMLKTIIKYLKHR